MSQGEESCKLFGNCTAFVSIEKCNKECEFYGAKDGSISKEIDQAAEKELRKEVRIHPSDLVKFDKVNEIVVLKKHVFLIQSVSPKKIILKFKKKLNKTDKLPDGCYIFKNPDDELLDPVQVLKKINHTVKKGQTSK